MSPWLIPMLSRRGITVLGLVLLIVAVIVALVVLSRYVAV